MRTTILICILAAAMAGCNAKQQGNTAVAAETTTAAQAAEKAKFNLPPDHPPLGTATAAAQPAAGTSSPSSSNEIGIITGQVAETMNAGGYTYLRVTTGGGDVWAAVPQGDVKKGSQVAVSAQMTMENFESKSLNRKFDKLVFGTLATPGANASMASAAPAKTAAERIKGGAADVGDVHVPKAEGANAHTIAETWAARAQVKDKPVVIRGKVVKFLPGIMGKNWLHLRDGSGAASKGDNDITVTTLENAAVGDVVTVSGVVRVDKDFGAGYLYPVIVEDAKVTKK